MDAALELQTSDETTCNQKSRPTQSRRRIADGSVSCELTADSRFLFLLLSDRKQLYFEDQSFAWADVASCTPVSIRQIGWDKQLPL